jgi:Flp pilus assembly protein protease CpaA
MVGGNAFATHYYDSWEGENGLTYYLDSETWTAEVVNCLSSYSGDLVIPSEVGISIIDAYVEIDLTYTVTSIGNGAFSYCTALTSITIPNSVTSIGYGAFSGCSGLTSVTFHCERIDNWFEGSRSIKEVVIGDEVKEIGDYAFGGLSSLTSVTIPNSVTSIGYGAFSHCTALTSVTIPNSVTSIGDAAFYGCSGLTSVTIPNSVTSIGSVAFRDCTGLTSITIPNSVTSIGSSAFFGCSGLTSVTIPNGVTSIGSSAFSGCSGLTSITIPNSVTSIGSSAFFGCSGLTSVTIPNSVTSIGSSAFSGCSGLTSITIPNSVTSIGESAFSGCSGLTSVTIPNSVTSIGERAFFGCRGLTSITIPESVTSIGSSAFSGCSGLTSITIPGSVTTIGGYAFSGCTGLTRVDYSSLEHLCSIEFKDVRANPLYYARHLFINGEELKDNLILPENITSIGVGAFNGCILKNVMLKHLTPPTISPETFSVQSCYHAVLYVPVGTWESYAYDDGWYSFINIRETATETAALTSTQAYTLMDAKSFAYLVYDPVNNRVNSIASTAIDENNPDHSWQLVEQDGQRYLYNIGAKKFAQPLADGKGLVLTGEPLSLTMANGEDGLLFDNQTDKQWAMVVNDKTAIDDEAIETVLTAISTRTVDASPSAMVSYNLNGLRQNAKQKGLNIIRMSDGTVKKVMVK